MRRAHRTRGIVAVGVAALLLTACGSSGGAENTGGNPAAPAQTEDAITVASQTPPPSMDPVDASGASVPYFQAVYDTLIHRNPDGSHSPWLATDWSWTRRRPL